MADAPFLLRAEPDDLGPSYAELREQGVAILQELAGDVWTDYNEHDPGVTLLEQLCYALTELGYRAGLPVPDLLSGPRGIEAARHALFPAKEAFPGCPLTIDDYRRLIADRVPEVANVWLRPLPPSATRRSVSGLYDIALYVPGADPCGCEGEPGLEDVRERALRVYTRHRNLCEDVRSVRVLSPIPTVVSAKITIDDSRAPEAILADVLFQIGLALAPEIRREPLRDQLARGRVPSEIFLGPELRTGFVPDDQLADRVTSLRVPDIATLVARTGGVLGVRDLSVRMKGHKPDERGAIPVPASGVPVLDTRAGPIELFRRGRACKIDAARALRELGRLWFDQRRRYPLSSDEDSAFPVPRGRSLDLAQYTSIQDQLPLAYGVNAYGPPDDATTLRLAQTRQLKGYLLVFEQLLADFFAQLAHARDLLSTDRALAETYFHQSLRDLVPRAAPLLDEGYEEALSRALRGCDPGAERRSRFLDVLLGLHGDGLSAVAGADPPADGPAEERLAQAKITLLERLTAATAQRGRGIDHRAAPSRSNVAGMEIRSRIELGLPAGDHRPLLESLEEAGMELVEEVANASLGRPLADHTGTIEETFELASVLLADGRHARSPGPVQATASLLRSHTVTESFLHSASRLAHYRAGKLRGEGEISLVCKAPEDDHFRLLGKFPDLGAALVMAVALVELIGTLHRRCQQLYIVEHSLLRFSRSRRGERRREQRASGEEAFSFSFTVSAVLSRAPGHAGDPAFEREAREVLRRNAPAHVAVEYCFLTPSKMRRFEELHRAWRDALHQRRGWALVHASTELRAFLARRGAST